MGRPQRRERRLSGPGGWRGASTSLTSRADVSARPKIVARARRKAEGFVARGAKEVGNCGYLPWGRRVDRDCLLGLRASARERKPDREGCAALVPSILRGRFVRPSKDTA